ncbi:MAG: formate/nitrite transporter family protein [Desulfobacterales bacterium]
MTDKKEKKSAFGLNKAERKDAVRRSAPKAAVVYEAIRREGKEELTRNTSALMWSGLAAGLSMGFSFLMEALLISYLPNSNWQPLVSKFGYCIGFLIVVLGRQQLFTENTLTPILQLLHRTDLQTLLHVLRLWVTVLTANITGAFLFALLIAKANFLPSSIDQILFKISQELFVGSFWQTFFSAVFAGWLIALMVWLLPFAESGRVTVIVIITYIVGLGHFAHIIAGSVNAFYALVVGGVSITAVASKFFVPALLGNIVGGVTFVSTINYAQVRLG